VARCKKKQRLKIRIRCDVGCCPGIFRLWQNQKNEPSSTSPDSQPTTYWAAQQQQAASSAAMQHKTILTAACCLSTILKGDAAAFTHSFANAASAFKTQSTSLYAIEIGPTDDDVDPPLPGQMKISEIKSELDLRKVNFKDCFDRESLEKRLDEARATGKADPSIIDEFNKRNLEANVKGEKFEVSDEMIKSSVGGDGTLPGGMPPDMLKLMMQDEELVSMLRSPKMQEIMKLLMSEGQTALEEAMKNDQETYECVQKLNQLMSRMNQGDK